MISPTEVDEFVAGRYPALAGSGVTCEALEEGRALVRWKLDEEQLRPGGYISGLTQSALADAALWFVKFSHIGLKEMAVTADLHISFLRPATGGDLYARARSVSVGARTIRGTVDLWMGMDPNRLVSHAVGSYAIPTS
ncbi:MAG TPA: PaaI family thioesterase [Acidimicrobiia bacterium]|nr:PaaI family thioesterase [Acidimicrobiia bacterium]